MIEPIPIALDAIDPPSKRIPVKSVEVYGRQQHEALLRDENKMLELGLDPFYERIVYLKRWGGYLND